MCYQNRPKAIGNGVQFRYTHLKLFNKETTVSKNEILWCIIFFIFLDL